MGVRISQDLIEALISNAERNFRLSQFPIEVVISDVSIPAKARISQNLIEVVLLSSSIPAITRRYGPRVQSV